MRKLVMMAACAVLVLGQAQDEKAPPPTDTQPTTQPAEKHSALRKPDQAEILRDLLRQREQTKPILPAAPAKADEDGVDGAAATEPDVMLDGVLISERPGRLVVEEGLPRFVFRVDANSEKTRSLVILRNQLLEAMEREAEAGFTEFIVTAEVTRYRGENFLLLRKILRRVSHGNVGP